MASADDLSLVLVNCIDHPRSRDRIRDLTGLPWEQLGRLLAELRRRGLARTVGGGQWLSHQRSCGGSCMRPASEMAGAAVEFDPETLRWFCADCWEGEIAYVRSLVDQPRGGEDG